ncbi:hypothetical protein UY3_01086 [Chelonia mydas]|uniref:Uncharacterized protein n=1 Tax=Chelonia mydas TaxID=8469 RepID=M7BV31_CHEMY|nr:hypothetical protein UY3_01086 [Chelonia mydas]
MVSDQAGSKNAPVATTRRAEWGEREMYHTNRWSSVKKRTKRSVPHLQIWNSVLNSDATTLDLPQCSREALPTLLTPVEYRSRRESARQSIYHVFTRCDKSTPAGSIALDSIAYVHTKHIKSVECILTPVASISLRSGALTSKRSTQKHLQQLALLHSSSSWVPSQQTVQ